MESICIIGLGYIGLPTALLFANSDTQVFGVDINPKVVDSLNKGKVHFIETGLQELLDRALSKNTFEVYSEITVATNYIVCVPTPLDREYNVADLSYVQSACKMIAKVLKKGDLVIIESTISPNSSETLFKSTLEKSGLVAGIDFNLVHCPERAIPGKTLDEMKNNHRIIGGVTSVGTQRAKDLYLKFVKEEKLHCTDIKTAEIVKLMENTSRDLNIALANEFALISEELGIDVWEAISLANLHPRVNILKPGPGVGGHCIAIDPWFLVESSLSAQLIQKARFINDHMPNYVLVLIKKLAKEIANFNTITILGISYKSDVDDSRETPALKLINLAEKEGFNIKIHDPHCKEFKDYSLLSLEEAVKDSDCLVLVTDHSIFKEINPNKISKLMRNKNLLDTRNLFEHSKWEDAGFNVKVLGRNKID